MKLRTALPLFAVMLLLLASGCDVLKGSIAVAGPKRYKSEVSSRLLQIKDELDNGANVSEATRSKFDKLLQKWEPTMGKNASFDHLKLLQEELEKIKTDPNNAFQHKNFASGHLEDTLRILETEIKE